MGRVQYVLARDGLEFLRQVADAETRTLADSSLIGRFLSEDHSEQRGFAGAVRSYQSNP
jgi:hypothetical protein